MDKSGMKHYDVIIVGGGITGAGTARDCAMRGLSTLLVERFDFTNGATGRNHGLLHSGARYAVTDGESAEECIKENMTLRKIARHCVDETDGLFITLPEDDLAYQATFIAACNKAGIRAEAIDPKEAIRLEPAVNRDLIGAVRVPDGSVDPFRLTMANVFDARLHGADVLNYHEVVSLIKDGDRVVGVELYDHNTKQTKKAYCDIVINAAGIWGQKIAQMAGAAIGMFPAKGALLVYGHRVNNVVINRCRKPANADILVPGDTVCVIGTTSDRVPIDTVDDMKVTPEEVEVLMREGEKLAPSLATTRILRAYAGVRPLVAADNDPSGRNISRGIVCLDHETRDGIPGFISITGGKLMTYRLMAEWATDLACKKLNRKATCETATTPIAGSELPAGQTPPLRCMTCTNQWQPVLRKAATAHYTRRCLQATSTTMLSCVNASKCRWVRWNMLSTHCMCIICSTCAVAHAWLWVLAKASCVCAALQDCSLRPTAVPKRPRKTL